MVTGWLFVVGAPLVYLLCYNTPWNVCIIPPLKIICTPAKRYLVLSYCIWLQHYQLIWKESRINSGIVGFFKVKNSIKLKKNFQPNAFPSLQYLLGTLSVINENSHFSVQDLLLNTPVLCVAQVL